MNDQSDDRKTTFFHYLIVRFSINLTTTDIFKKKRDPLDPEYLDKRFSFFTQYCLPSLKNQTNKNFVLIIVIDAQLRLEYQEKLKKLTKNTGFDTLLVKYKGSFELNDLLNPYELDMMRRTQTRTGKIYVCTTRLDDDDALNPHYFQYAQREIQTILDKKLVFRPFIHTLVYGNYLLVKEDKCFIRKVKKPRLACGLSLVNRIGDMMTIYSKSHHRWHPDEYTCYHNLYENMYFILAHEENDSQRYEQEKNNIDTFISISCGKPIHWYFNYVNGLLETYSNPGLRQLQTNVTKVNRLNKPIKTDKIDIQSTTKPVTKTYQNPPILFRYDMTKLKGAQKVRNKKK